MKPRIFIDIHYMELGGAEMALIGLLNAIDPARVDVDLFIHRHTGPYMRLIPKYINILQEVKEYSAIETPWQDLLKQFRFSALIRKCICNLAFKRYLSKSPGNEAIAPHFYMDQYIKSLPRLSTETTYDLAISFLDPPHVVQDKVNARKTMEWIHTDFTAFKYDKEMAYKRWANNDYIVSISDDITKSFTSLYPGLSCKVIKIENIISPSFVRQRAEEFFPAEYDRNEHHLCSIGRIGAWQKNFVIIPYVAQCLKNMGIKFKWVVIGPGENLELVKRIEETNTADVVKMIGPKDNPYPYIKSCDVYIQPSMFEGKSICVREAQILCKPVVITNYPTASSQISNERDGIICEMDSTSIANAVRRLLCEEPVRQKIIDYLQTHDYGMTQEINKLYELINV